VRTNKEANIDKARTEKLPRQGKNTTVMLACSWFMQLQHLFVCETLGRLPIALL